MNINFLNNQSIKNLSIANKSTYHFNFKGLEEDSFKRTTQQTIDSQSDENPNTAFLRDENLSHEEKIEKLAQSKIIYSSTQLTKKLGKYQKSWFNPKAFIFEEYTNTDSRGRKSPAKKIFDLTIPLNKQNFEYLESIKEKAKTPEELQLKYNITSERYNRFVKNGILKPIMLKDINNEDVPTKLIDLSEEHNVKGMEQVKQLTPIRSDINQQLIRIKQKPIIKDVYSLSSLGIGTPKEIASLVKQGKIKGELIRNEEGKINNALIDLNDTETADRLQKMRRQRCVGIETLAKQSGIDIGKIENEILAGNLKAIREIVFIGDPMEILIDAKDPKTNETFDKLLFEHKVEIELEKQLISDEKRRKKEDKSLKMKIAWQLCPKTRNCISNLVKNNAQFKELLTKKTALEEIIKELDEESNEKAEAEQKLAVLTKEEEIELKKFFKTMWATVGSTEYKDALKQANEILLTYRNKGINAINDPEIRELIINSNK